MLRILVIDDNLADVSLLRHGLDATEERYELEVILDGESALKQIRKLAMTPASAEPCVVVLDLHLPKIDGMSILKVIRATPALADLKTAVITSGASPRQEQELLALKVDLYRSKPRDLEEFFDLGQQLIELCHDKKAGMAA